MDEKNNLTELPSTNCGNGENNSPAQNNSGSQDQSYNDEYDNYCPWE